MEAEGAPPAAAAAAPPADGASQAIVVVADGAKAVIATGQVKTFLPSAEELAKIKTLATQTKAIGVILPPPDIRAIVDKTSQFVAKHGVQGKSMREHGQGRSPLCNVCGSPCMQPEHPHHAPPRRRI
jgi:hypothetical protein